MSRNGLGALCDVGVPRSFNPALRLMRERVLAKKEQAPWTEPQRSCPSGQTARRGIERDIPR